MKLLFGLLAVATLAGCSTYAVPRYSISADNVVALKSTVVNGVGVGAFTQSPMSNQSPNEIMCRGVGPIKTPDGEPFADFVKSGLVSELKIAGVYAPGAPVQLTGRLDSIDFSSVSGAWNLGLTVSSSNGRSLSVAENYSYASSYYGETACNQTAQALMPAVQDLIAKVVHSPEFTTLLK
ncbi:MULTISPECIES: hypothetical protein [Paraburkholderia]|uniref:hypothetical protein n=1 Tax=Paraburkholderia TaxID=1822464 RepID=UPI000475CEA6|nr:MULTISPECIES: hypothetical protein [Paraburkholderia]MDH6149479.1 hypothetical protein [Paraburkholderia sp. WSM4179]